MNINTPYFRHRYLDLRPLVLQYPLNNSAGQLIGWGMHDPKWWRNFLHSHSFFEVCFAFQGTGEFHINDETFVIKKGDMFLARPGETHEIISDEISPLGIYYWSFILPKLRSIKPPHSSLDQLLFAFEEGGTVVAQPAGIEPVLQLITAELNEMAPGFTTGVQGLGAKLLLETLRCFAGSFNAGSNHGGPLGSLESQQLLDPQSACVNDMIQFIHDNYARPIKVKNVAAQVHLSERHANRQFKLATGRPIMTYLTELRLEKARELLLDLNLLIGEVSLAIGIEDVRYFSTLFRKHTGLSPSTYRVQKGTTFVSTE